MIFIVLENHQDSSITIMKIGWDHQNIITYWIVIVKSLHIDLILIWIDSGSRCEINRRINNFRNVIFWSKNQCSYLKCSVIVRWRNNKLIYAWSIEDPRRRLFFVQFASKHRSWSNALTMQIMETSLKWISDETKLRRTENIEIFRIKLDRLSNDHKNISSTCLIYRYNKAFDADRRTICSNRSSNENSSAYNARHDLVVPWYIGFRKKEVSLCQKEMIGLFWEMKWHWIQFRFFQLFKVFCFLIGY